MIAPAPIVITASAAVLPATAQTISVAATTAAGAYNPC